MRHFTVDEANAMLPMVRPILENLQELRGRMVQGAVEVHDFEMLASQNGHGEHSAVFSPEYDLRKIHADIQERVRYLQDIGCILKDLEQGIVDFPTRMGGRDVYLCWRLGEEAVTHWHDIDSGFSGRQRL